MPGAIQQPLPYLTFLPIEVAGSRVLQNGNESTNKTPAVEPEENESLTNINFI
uniref:Uncharacterized protein n=1 Tax=Siphoviridae sp. ct3z32 TaxID=2825327 RepID=A0A8S5VHI4_9CAUD|nr:MAG TPA: hypothetical protein [Siphoviridae sp. ct3z32]